MAKIDQTSADMARMLDVDGYGGAACRMRLLSSERQRLVNLVRIMRAGIRDGRPEAAAAVVALAERALHEMGEPL